MTSKITRTESAITNLQNGNISDAKNHVKNVSYWRIMTDAEALGCSIVECIIIAKFLKGHSSFQEYCDNTQKLKEGTTMRF